MNKVKKFTLGIVGSLFKIYNKIDYKTQKYAPNERPIEYAFVLNSLLRTYTKTILDIGTGYTALPAILNDCGYIVAASDNIVDYWKDGLFNKHFHVENDDITDTKLKQTYDFITCISVLEHIKKNKEAVKNIFSLLKPEGYLVLTFPYNERKYIENAYELEDSGYGKNAPFICQVYSKEIVNSWCLDNNAEIIEQEYWKIFSGEYWTVENRLEQPIKVEKEQTHQLTCILIKKKS